MKPTQRFPDVSLNNSSASKPKLARPEPRSRFAAFMVIFWSIFATMAAAATIASGELPLFLGGM